MIACLIASALLTAQSVDDGPQFTTMGPGIYKVDRKSGSLHYFNGIAWEGEMGKGPIRCVFSGGYFVWTAPPSSTSTIIAHYNRPTGTFWEQVPRTYANVGPFTPLLYGSPAKSSKVFGIVGTGSSARLCFFETKRRRLILPNPAFEVKRGWRSILMVEDATAIINTPEGLKDVNLQGDDSEFSAAIGNSLPEISDGFATDGQGNALIGAPMVDMFFFVDKREQLGQFVRNSRRKWEYRTQGLPPNGWTILAKARPITVKEGIVAVQVQHKEKKVEGLILKTLNSGEWTWSRVMELPSGVKFDPRADLNKSSVGTGYDAVYGLGDNGKFYRFLKTIGEPWKVEGGF